MTEIKDGNILDYAREEMRTFSEKPFNDVDSLILSQLCYTRLNGLVGSCQENRKPAAMYELLRAEHFPFMFSNSYGSERNKGLLLALAASPRFRDIGLNYYCESTSEKYQKQFASVTFILPDGRLYVAFRGTDSSIVGWKEDFNMSFMKSVPSQTAAVKHLERVAELTEAPIITGGHSKGGNLAIYSGAKCKWEVFERIDCIYSHDGPGFQEDAVREGGFENAMAKVKKTVPEFSLVGMCLTHMNDYRVVCSNERLLLQHDPFSWRIKDGDFVYTDEISGEADLINSSVTQWLKSIDDKSRERFVDTLYTVIESVGVESVQDVAEEWKKSAVKVFEAIKDLDPDTKRFIISTLHSLGTLYVKKFRDRGKRKGGLVQAD